jgi:hypothetical protein
VVAFAVVVNTVVVVAVAFSVVRLVEIVITTFVVRFVIEISVALVDIDDVVLVAAVTFVV